MSANLQIPKGTRDIVGNELLKFNFIKEHAYIIADRFDVKEIISPIFEHSEVFEKPLGLDSDIITKERYSFLDRKSRSLTLRPEGTSSVVRYIVQNSLANQILRLFYFGAMFRYERPQKGRYRQFYQFGMEFFGSQGIFADLEILNISVRFLHSIGISNFTLQINTVGDNESRSRYKIALVDYLNKYKNDLSKDSQKRLKINPLRILDSKNKSDIKILQQCPKIDDFLSIKSKNSYEKLKEGLDCCNILFEENSKLVRGLDYYNDCVFEIVSNEIGSQSAILGGGRYDKLVFNMNGKYSVPAVGFACGIDRLVLLVKSIDSKSEIFPILVVGNEVSCYAWKIYNTLHDIKINTKFMVGTRLKKLLGELNKQDVNKCLILGSREEDNKEILIKDMNTTKQVLLPLDKIKKIRQYLYE